MRKTSPRLCQNIFDPLSGTSELGPFGDDFMCQGRRYHLEVILYYGLQDSPFQDGTDTCTDAIITNPENGKQIGLSFLLPDLIMRYGFYEGHGTRYRLDPRDVLQVFDFLKK